MARTIDENTTLAQGLEALFAGEFDQQLTRRKKRRARRLNRLHTRAVRSGRESEFYDELIGQMETDDHCCRLAPGLLAHGGIDQDTALGLKSDGFFQLIDGLLERLPAILDAIMMIMKLFAAAIVAAFAMTPSDAHAQRVRICNAGGCRWVDVTPAAPAIAQAVTPQSAPATVALPPIELAPGEFIVGQPTITTTVQPMASQPVQTRTRTVVRSRPVRTFAPQVMTYEPSTATRVYIRPRRRALFPWNR